MNKSDRELQKLENKISTLISYFKRRLPNNLEGHKLAIKITIQHAERAGWIKPVGEDK